jgi:hypothetical protein
MAKRGRTAATAETSVGRCGLCGSTVEKSKMTRHIGACLRKGGLVSDSEGVKTFHIVVEGRRRPEYWMHLYVPSTATLEDLDSFLRDTWLECCGHLSAFAIAGKTYSSDMESFDDFSGPADEEDEPELGELTEEEIQQAAAFLEVDPEILKGIAEAMPKWMEQRSGFANSTPEMLKAADFQEAAARLGVSPEQVKQFVDKMVSKLQEVEELRNLLLEEWEDDEEEDKGMDVPLEEVLSKGMKFSHEYDFGTTTELSLRVVAEGYAQPGEDDEAIQVLARNNPPLAMCETCGNSVAERICPMYSRYGVWLCKKCARKHKCDRYFSEDMLLPVVNSPRAGVCGYTGNEED